MMKTMGRKIRQIHFVGIGGIGMSGIAEVLLNLGYRVTGSDLRASQATERLAGLGATVTVGHKVENIEGADVVVTSTTVGRQNVEAEAARQAMIPVIPRAEMLAELMRMKYSVAIAGSHGKTSTTSMVAHVLSHAGLDPTVVIGGRLDILGSNAKLGSGDLMVAEADESDGTFLKLTPTIAVVTNIDSEHLDFYGDMEKVETAFLRFINQVPFYGTAILCLDEPRLQDLIPQAKRRVVTFGLSAQADVAGEDVELVELTSSFAVRHRGTRLGTITLRRPGRHNVLNALAAVSVGLDLEVPFEQIREGLENFRGVDRRMQIIGETGGVLVMDDYGHHPTEIQATLDAVKDGWRRRTVVIFQPHRFSRVNLLREDFFRSFLNADELVVTDVYPAGEQPIKGVDAGMLVEGIRQYGQKNIHLVNQVQDVAAFLEDRVQEGDLVITLGAGDVHQAGRALLRLLAGEESD
jgi:UDP-N-acetylmuramate--alanine ligase